jgi:hypothetical protein
MPGFLHRLRGPEVVGIYGLYSGYFAATFGKLWTNSVMPGHVGGLASFTVVVAVASPPLPSKCWIVGRLKGCGAIAGVVGDGCRQYQQ